MHSRERLLVVYVVTILHVNVAVRGVWDIIIIIINNINTELFNDNVGDHT